MSQLLRVLPQSMETEGAQRVPDPEVSAKPVRRKFSAEYKRRIVQEAAGCKPGEIGALLRREGLYSSHLAKWRHQSERAEMEALSAKKRGPKPQPVNPLTRRVAELERENERLQHKLTQAEAIIEVQKKISEILGIDSSKKGSTS